MNSFTHRQRPSWTAGLFILLLSFVIACGDSNEGVAPGGAPAEDSNAGPQGSSNVQPAPWSCQYTNRFSNTVECKNFTGSGWTADGASADCEVQQDSTFSEGECSTDATLGQCEMESTSPTATVIVFPGQDQSQCAITQQGCEVFAGGTFTASQTCAEISDMIDESPAPSPIGGNVFYPPELICAPSVDETPGLSPANEVCTWQSIGGCTEPGRLFTDYASCEPVLTQRPFFPVPPSPFKTAEGDPLYEDDTYLAEVAWVKGEAEACGCVCCHTSELSPQGAAAFDTAAEGIWTDTFTERGLAVAAGWIDSSPLGAHAVMENNGFDRSATGLPTTDTVRMIRFFEGELARRGVERSRFEGALPIGGPLYTQGLFSPEPCEAGEGIDENNTIRWSGGSARYVFVLEVGSDNPGVPPNLDSPAGTLWKLDVDSRSDPITSGLTYGSIPANTFQTIPADGVAPALAQGARYYLYVLADVGSPITRCTFEYEGSNSQATVDENPSEMQDSTPTDSSNWNEACSEDTDCTLAADYCVKMPGDTDGYCSQHCDSTAACVQAGAPASWTCNAVSCSIPDFTWCGPASEIEESNNFLSVCN